MEVQDWPALASALSLAVTELSRDPTAAAALEPSLARAVASDAALLAALLHAQEGRGAAAAGGQRELEATVKAPMTSKPQQEGRPALLPGLVEASSTNDVAAVSRILAEAEAAAATAAATAAGGGGRDHLDDEPPGARRGAGAVVVIPPSPGDQGKGAGSSGWTPVGEAACEAAAEGSLACLRLLCDRTSRWTCYRTTSSGDGSGSTTTCAPDITRTSSSNGRRAVDPAPLIARPDMRGRTAVFYACTASTPLSDLGGGGGGGGGGDARALQVLASSGLFDLQTASVDPEGNTAAFHCAVEGNADCLRVLATHGVDLSRPCDRMGNTPAFHAARESHVDCLRALAATADVDLAAPCNAFGDTVVDVAAGQQEVLALLRDHFGRAGEREAPAAGDDEQQAGGRRASHQFIPHPLPQT